MFYTKSYLAALVALTANASESTIREFAEGDNPSVLMDEFEFSVISFYNSEEWSKEINDLLEGAKSFFEESIKSSEWSERNVGWFRVNIDEHPEMAFDDTGLPDQMVFNRELGLSRFVHYQMPSEDVKESEEHLAYIVQDLTGDWIHEIDCSNIQSFDRVDYDEVVFFGQRESLDGDGIAYVLNEVSMTDRYNYDTQSVSFYYNSDPECRANYELDTEKEYIIFFNGENSLPVHMEVGADSIDFEHLMLTLNSSIVKGTPKWSTRAYSSLYDYYMNGLVFLMEEGSLTNVEESKDDWRVSLMAKITEWTQENESSFIPIIGQWDEDDVASPVPSIAAILKADDKEDLPHIYVLHSASDTAIKYPEKLDDINKYTPELIIAWAEKELIQFEIDDHEFHLAHDEEIADEERKIVEEMVAYNKEHLKVATKHYEQELEAIKEVNHFADNLADHREVAKAHMARIE